MEIRCRAALAVLATTYVAVMVTAQCHKLASLEMGFDLALHEQIIWNTAHGRWFASSALANTTIHLGRDVIGLELILAPAYGLVPDTRTLLVLQTLAIAAGALPLYALARRRLGALSALCLAAAYLAYKPLHFLNLYEFQARAFALAPLLGMFWFADTGRFRPFLICITLVLCTRSDMALVVTMFGVYAFLSKQPKHFGVAPLLLGLSWFALAVLVVIPHFNAGGPMPYLEWYDNLGRTPWDALVTILTRPSDVLETVLAREKLLLLGSVFGLVGFLPLLRPDVLVVGLPTLAMCLLSDREILSSIRKQYPAALYPIAFVATVLAIEWLAHRRFLARFRAGAPAALAAAVLACNVVTQWISPPTTWRWLTHWERPAFATAVDRLVARIPPDATVAVSSRVAPLLARREGLYLFPPQSQGFYSDQGLLRADLVLYETPPAGSEDPWRSLLEQDPWVLVGVGHYEPKEYRYYYRLYRRRKELRRG
jgi:uncharacterized membrane protein